METTLTTNQKIALAQHLNILISMSEWNDDLWRYFEDYKPFKDQQLDYSILVSTLKALPLEAKRDYIWKLLNLWALNTHYDLSTLYDTFQNIMYLKIGGGEECVLFNLIINLSSYFEGYKFIFINRPCDIYTVKMLIEVNRSPQLYDNEIQFNLSIPSDPPLVQLFIPAPLLKLKMNYSDQPDRQDLNELIELLTTEHQETHCPRTYLDYSLRGYYSGPYDAYLYVEFKNIEYVDNSGE